MKLKSFLVCCVLIGLPSISLAQQKTSEMNPTNPKLSGLLSYLDTDGQSLSLSDDESFLEDIALMADKVLTPNIRKQRGMENFSMLAIMKALGFDNITASGSSSKRHGPIHLKKLFVETKNNNRGIFSLLGAKPAPYVAAGFAPSDTDLIIETQLNLTQVYETVIRVTELTNPTELNGLKKNFSQKIPGSNVTIKDFLSKLDARISLAAELNIQNRKMPFRVTMRIDNVANFFWSVMEDQMKQQLKIKSNGNIHSFDLPPIKGIVPVSVIFDTDANYIWITTNPEHLALCQAKNMKLATSEPYLAATNGLPKTGSSQLYLSKKAISTFIMVAEQEVNLDKAGVEMQGARDAWKEIKQLIINSEGLACGVQKNQDGLLTVMNTPFRLRNSQLLFITPVLASIATPIVIAKRKEADRVKTMVNMMQLKLPIIEFQNKHGRYPKNIAELATMPGYTIRQINQFSVCRTDQGEMELAYINCDGKPDGSIVLYTPAPINGKYVVLLNDGSVQNLEEREFNKLLAATKK